MIGVSSTNLIKISVFALPVSVISPTALWVSLPLPDISMETVPGGGSSPERSLMWSGLAAGDLAPVEHQAVSACRPYLKRRPLAAKPHRHAPLPEDLAQHLPDVQRVSLRPGRAPGVVLKSDMFVWVFRAAPGPRQVSVAGFPPVV